MKRFPPPALHNANSIVFTIPIRFKDINCDTYYPVFKKFTNNDPIKSSLTKVFNLKNKQLTRFPWNSSETELLPLANKLVLNTNNEDVIAFTDVDSNNFSTLIEETSSSSI